MIEKPIRKFIGKFYCTLDDKSRLTVPSKFRELIPGETGSKILIIGKAKDRCLNLLTLDYYDWIIEQLGTLPPGPKQRSLIRFYSSESEQLAVDRVGRVQMPSYFLEALGSSKSLVVVGALTHMEIWRQEDFEKIRQEANDTYRESDWEL
jgi:MraZ protein